LRELNTRSDGLLDPRAFPDEIFEYYSIPAFFEQERPLLTPGREILSAKLILQPGTVLFGKLNPRVEKVWKVGNYSPHRKIGTTEWFPILPDKSRVHPDFLFYLLKSQHVMPRAQSLVSGSTPSRERVDAQSFYALDVPLPPLPEQESIAAVLTEAEAAVKAETERLRAARELKQAALAEVFTRGLWGDGQRETAYGPVPESWTEKPLSTCAYVQTGVAKNTRNVPADAGEVPYLRVANVQDGHLDLSEMKTIRMPERDIEACLLRDGDVVLTEGGDFDKLGRGFIWEGQIPRCVHQNHVFAVRADRNQLNPVFFAYLAQSPYGKAYFLSVAHKTTNLACINTTKLRAFPVLLPTMDEQQEIGGALRAIDAKIAHHEARQRVLRELFASLLRDLMTGRRRVAVESKKAPGGP
jgi:type I restriction enzyme S subunit